MKSRTEYPRPQFVRKDWLCLNGTWDFRFEDQSDWQDIQVPFVFQSEKSGIGTNRMCDNVVYKRNVQIPKEWKGKRIRLHFGAVDYQCRVYINGKMAGRHTGGNIGFSFDITELLNWEEEELVVEVHDPCTDETIPRGKQYWMEQPDSIWYTRSTGIWQPVWLEPLSEIFIRDVKFTPDIDRGTVQVDYRLSGLDRTDRETTLRIAVSMKGEQAANVTVWQVKKEGSLTLSLYENRIFRTANHNGGWCWSPESPNLFDVSFVLEKEGEILDLVNTYFGMRKVETRNGMLYLNNRPYIPKLVLDQGYWEGGLMTAERDEDFKQDILLAKEMGFNGCRKHQKSEDPRFLYWADVLGYLVWGEIGACAQYSRCSVNRTMQEWSEAVDRDYNHPCIMAWVVLNESWGVPFIRTDKSQQAHSLALYYHVKSLDSTRLVIGNDGWEMTKTDICAIHNYNHGEAGETEKQERFRESLVTLESILYAMPAGRQVYAEGFSYGGEPVMLTEFGGIAFGKETKMRKKAEKKIEKEWGYTNVKTGEEFLKVYARLLSVIQDSEVLSGYCYTQLTDVEQEVNGLLTTDRTPKVDVEKIREINEKIEKYLLGKNVRNFPCQSIHKTENV
ncbi:MAG: glycoside hydrolase family 2 [Ruminococcus sp.]|nr:glycoside hydrolase family 2 [Ruminococcus sp.]